MVRVGPERHGGGVGAVKLASVFISFNITLRHEGVEVSYNVTDC